MKNKNTKKYRSFNEYLIEHLKNPEEAEIYLRVSLEEYEKDGDTEFFLMALKNVAKAQGGIGYLASRTSLNRQSLYKALSSKGNPKFNTLGAILHGLGYRLSIQPITQ